MSHGRRFRPHAAIPTVSPGGWRALVGPAVLALALTTCSDQTGPTGPVPGYLALAPRFVSEVAGVVPVSKGRFVLSRQPGGEVALDTVLAIPAGSDSVDLTFTVSLNTPDETFLLRFALIGPPPANDTVFRAGPLQVTPATSGQPTPVDVPLVYTGTGANAARVVFTPPAAPIVAGIATAVVAQALDSAGQPIPGTPIGWRSLDTNIVRVPNAATASVVGVARGSGRVVASLVTGPADTAIVSVTLPPATIVADSGSGQTGPAAALLPAPLVARVTASDGVGVPGVLVRFAVTVGGGSVSADTVRTDSAGRARVTWTLGNVVGTQTVTATTTALPTQSATFSATSQATGAGTVTVVAGDNQSALVGTPVAVAPQVRVTDAQSNPVPNVEVIFAVTQGGGTFTGGIDTTDAAGLAAVGSWTLGGTVGLNAMTATVAGLTPVQFLALGTSTGGVTSMTLNAGDGQTALAGTAVSIAPSVLLTDTAGTPIAGVAVPFTVTLGGGTLADSAPVSDASGIASVGTWTLGSAGTNALTARLPGLPNVNFTATGTVGAPAQVVIVSGDGQSDTVGTALPNPLVVEVRDSAGNAVPNIPVTWATLNGSVNPTSSTTNAQGQAQTTWTLGVNQINQTATAAVAGLTPAVFNATAIFPNPSILLALTGGNRVRVGSIDTLEVTLTAPAPAGGVFVTVTSGNTAVLTVDTTTGGVLIPQGQNFGTVLVEGIAGGSATLTATAPNYTDGQLTVPVSVQVLSMPATLNVPFGATASLPVQISTPAGAGGEVITLVSNDPTVLQVVTPSVTIPQGSQTTNATVAGLLPGPATVTGTSTNYGVSATRATVTANLNIIRTSVTIDASFGDTLRIRLESGGSPIAAPSPGVPVTLTPRDPTCVSAVSPVTIPTGLVDIGSVITHGGNPQLPCSTYVVASATNIAPDSIPVTVNPQPAINANTVLVGAGLQTNTSASLGTSQHGGVSVTLRVLDSSLVLVAPDQNTVGSGTLVRTLPNGTSSFSYYIQAIDGVADTGVVSVAMVASAPGFRPDTVVHTVRRTGYELVGVNTTTTTFSPEDPFYVQLGVLNTTGTSIQAYQNRRPGVPALTVTAVLSDSTVAQLVTATDTGGTVTTAVAAGFYYSPTSVASGGVAFDPLQAGSSSVTATIPGLVALTNVRTSTITAPAINANGLLVGAGLQTNTSGSLGASQHGGVDVTLQVLDSSLVLIAPDQNTVGTGTLVRTLPNGSTSFGYFIQAFDGVADTGVVSVAMVVSAPGFTPDTVVHTVRRTGYELVGVNTTTTTFSPEDPFYVQLGVVNTTGTSIQAYQNRRPGVPDLTVTAVLSDSTVAQLVTATDTGGTVTAAIVPGRYYSPTSVATGGMAFDPLQAGSSSVTATIPGLVALTNVRTSTITAPAINANGLLVGAGLQTNTSGSLGASQHGGVDVTLQVLDSSLVLIAPDQNTVGSGTLVRTLPNGSTGFSYYIQAIDGVADTGVVSVTMVVSAPGFTPDTVVHTVRRAGYVLSSLSSSTTSLSGDDPFYVQVGVLNTTGTSIQAYQNRRVGGGPLPVTVTSASPAVGLLVTDSVIKDTVTVQVAEGIYYSPTSVATGGVAFRPLTSGTTTVQATIAGLVGLANAVNVTVSTPGITVGSATVGAGLVAAIGVQLGASQHGGVNVVVKSSNPAVMLVALTSSTAGADSIVINIPNGSSSRTVYVHGIEFQTGTVLVTARANGFTDGSGSSSVVTPAVEIQGLVSSIAAGANNDAFYVQIGVPNVNNTGMQQYQNVRTGAPGPLTATIQTETSGYGLLVTQAAPNGATSVTVQIQPGLYYSPTSLAGGGVEFDPIAPGTISVFATIPTFVALPNATRSVTVTP